MKKIYITGVAGTGKSTVAREFKDREIDVFDVDNIKGLCSWRNKHTLQKTDYHSGASREWLDAHEWICDIEKLKTMMNVGKDVVVVVGVPTNQSEMLPLFDKVFLLQCSESVLVPRLTNRVGIDEFGKTPDEQKLVLDSRQDFEKEMIAKGAISINGEDSTEVIADNIFSKI